MFPTGPLLRSFLVQATRESPWAFLGLGGVSDGCRFVDFWRVALFGVVACRVGEVGGAPLGLGEFVSSLEAGVAGAAVGHDAFSAYFAGVHVLCFSCRNMTPR